MSGATTPAIFALGASVLASTCDKIITMAKKVLLPLAIALIGLTFPSFAPTGFTLLVVEEQSGVGVPGLRVTDENGMVRYTGAHGELVIWNRSSRFEIQDEHNEFVNMGATLNVTPGGRATLRVHRRTYR